MGMDFDKIDIDQMFAEAAGAAENTEEKDPESYGKNPKVKPDTAPKLKKETKKSQVKTEEEKPIETPEKQPIETPVEKHVETPVEKPVEKPVETPKKEEMTKDKLGPLLKQEDKRIISDGVNVQSIGRIIEMKEILDNYNATELKFVKGYFQSEKAGSAEIIYKALTTNTRKLDALNKIVIARGYSAADRAFYLMELDLNSIQAIHEQVDLLTGELEGVDKVTEINKIKICRILEKAISEMTDDVFIYINKLQQFTNKAIS